MHVRGLLGTARTLRAEDVVAVGVQPRHRSRSSWVLVLELRQPEDKLVLRGRWELDEDPRRVAEQLWSHGFPS
nr:PH domain-containing protein [Lolliginicoccus lacisalsi]